MTTQVPKWSFINTFNHPGTNTTKHIIVITCHMYIAIGVTEALNVQYQYLYN